MPITRTCGPRICHVSDLRADDIPFIEHPGFAEHHYSSLVRREGMFPAHCQLFWSPEAMKRYSIWSVDFAKEDCLKGLQNCGLLWVHDKSDHFFPLFTPKPMAQGGSSPGNVVWTHGNSYASNDNFRRLLQFMDEAGLAYDPPLPKPLNSAQLPDLSGLYEVIGVATPTPSRITGLPNNRLVSVQAESVVPDKFDEIYSKAPAAKLEIDATADEIADMFGGQVAKAPIKSQERAIQKIINDYGGDASRIKDLARNTIIVSPDKMDSVVAELAQRGANVKVTNGATDLLGYSGVNSAIKTQAGIFGEVQVNTPAMIYAKEPEPMARALLGDDLYNSIATKSGIPGGQGHKLYEQWRVLPSSDPGRSALEAQSKAYYDAVRRSAYGN